MADITKRLHYFDQQFLVEADFNDEQKYHLDRRRRHNRLLHTFGVAEGLDVIRDSNNHLTVKAGTAIDKDGREIVLDVDEPVPLNDTNKFKANTRVFITIGYQEIPRDFQPQDPIPPPPAPPINHTRFEEKPLVLADTVTPPTDGSVILLTSFTLDASGNIPATITNNPARAGGRGVVSASLAGVSNPGGDIKVVGTQAIRITPNDTTNEITIGETHSTIVGNAHGLTLADLELLEVLPKAKYDLRQRADATKTFTQADASQSLSIPFTFQPKFVLAYAVVNAQFTGTSTRMYGGVTTGYFDAAKPIQHGFGMIITKFGATDWTLQGRESGAVCNCQFIDMSLPSQPAETLVITIMDTVATPSPAVNLQFTRSISSPPAGPLAMFTIKLYLVGMG